MRGHSITPRGVALAWIVAMIALIVAGCGGRTSPTVVPTVSQTEFRWPESEIASLLPVPESTVGTLEWETATGILVRLRNISRDQYDSYVDACREQGFVNDSIWSDDSYSAYNEAGYFLMLECRKNAMSIEMKAPAETKEPDRTEKATVAETTAPTTTVPTTTVQEIPVETSKAGVPIPVIRPELQEAIESFEAFIDEYIAFMIKYEDAPYSEAMEADYDAYLAKYAEATAKIDALDESDWSEAESAYAWGALYRVEEKLATLLP
jgi:hypothetical protein